MKEKGKEGLCGNRKQKERLPLPIGVSDYRLATTEYYYVDKTLMIRDFIEERPMVSLLPGPGVLERH